LEGISVPNARHRVLVAGRQKPPDGDAERADQRPPVGHVHVELAIAVAGLMNTASAEIMWLISARSRFSVSTSAHASSDAADSFNGLSATGGRLQAAVANLRHLDRHPNPIEQQRLSTLDRAGYPISDRPTGTRWRDCYVGSLSDGAPTCSRPHRVHR
jgi:hypothetical protein